MGETREDAVVDLRLDRAHSARIYDWFLGGRTNFAADREAGEQVLRVFPAAGDAARMNRAFMHRAVSHLAREGLTQFLDIGTGIPTSPNLHEIVQGITPAARVVYTDNDPIVLAHAAALLRGRPEGRTTYVQADATVPDSILRAPELLATLDLDRPVALTLNAVLHFVPDDGRDRAHALVERLKAALPSGSALVVTHGTSDFSPPVTDRITDIYERAGTPLQLRSEAEFRRFFDGWELVEPGVTLAHRWRPGETGGAGRPTAAEAICYAAIAVKP
ncbi:SAM-dependent methyltransferase [Streptomyces sp. NPDC008001]|uniref:SAM-dependent methyltransferase n=1 Tax=Streptomyces sp. NPDC008001 TaxID=3364804 RepID=UPI0036E2C8F6